MIGLLAYPANTREEYDALNAEYADPARMVRMLKENGADYGVILFGAVMMFLVSLKGRSGSVRKQLAEKSVPVQVIVWFLLFFSILILGAYGVGYDSNQFIYNQF